MTNEEFCKQYVSHVGTRTNSRNNDLRIYFSLPTMDSHYSISMFIDTTYELPDDMWIALRKFLEEDCVLFKEERA